MIRFFGIVCLILFVGPSTAQIRSKKGNEDAEFKVALQAFKQGKYEVALKLFAPLTKDYSNQERSVYSHYYYASAAQHLDKDKEGWNMLQQLFSRYPGWGEKDEAHYLAGLLNFKQKNYYRALDYLHRISTTSYQHDVNGLKQHFLANIKDLATLKGLHKQFPDDRILAGYLVRAVNGNTSSSKQDIELARSLTSRFKFTEGAEAAESKKSDKKEKSSDVEKQYYDIAVLLPYRIDAFEPSNRSRSNQYVFDYYQGLLMAQKQLAREKIDVRLHAYDVSNVKLSVANLAREEEFRRADLVLGPLHQETSEEAAEYSRKSGVVVVNPLSTDSKLISDKFSDYYLAHASLGLQAKQVARVASAIHKEVRAAVYYGESSKDSALAMLYAAEIKSTGGTVVSLRKIGSTSEAMAQILTQDVNSEVSHVVYFSTEPRSGRAFLGLMKGAGYEGIPLIATATSFDRYNTDFSIYGRDIYLLDTDYIDSEKSDVKKFQYEYYQANNTLPSAYSYQGYDHLLFFARKLYEFKGQIGQGIKKARHSERIGYLLEGFDFRNSQENRVFVIRKYQGNTWISLDDIAGN